MESEDKEETVSIGMFGKGINNIAPDDKLPENSLTSAINVDISKEGNISKTNNYTKVYTGEVHSLYNNYFVEDNILKKLNADYTATDITAVSGPLTYCTVNNQIYYSDGIKNGIVENGELSTPTPGDTPHLVNSASGSLEEGLYLVSVSFINDTTGLQGGSTTPKSIYSTNGIQLNSIPQLPGYTTNVYISGTNSDALYLVAETTEESLLITSNDNASRIIDTLHMNPLPPGSIMRYYRGRVYVANDTTLWFSQPMRFGLCIYGSDFYNFSEDITIVQPVEDGLFVVAGSTYFISGHSIDKVNITKVSDDTGIFGTGITVDGNVFNLENELKSNTDVAYWFSNKGGILGLPNGSIKLLTENRYALDEERNIGVTLLKEVNGLKQLITNFPDDGEKSAFVFGAQASATIIRNGIEIN